ncbi:MAG: hypothetical protein D5R98_05480 [Desulfonatronovibrio sp. MSAO_Bac4]|nr:MAG: hypothetical protein D5R98_05480 [Desulfonatronovibrio sp. MSAO_Bac4]
MSARKTSENIHDSDSNLADQRGDHGTVTTRNVSFKAVAMWVSCSGMPRLLPKSAVPCPVFEQGAFNQIFRAGPDILLTLFMSLPGPP